MVTITRKLLKKLPIWYVSNNLASRKGKTTFKLQWKVFVETIEHCFMGAVP